MCNEEEEARSTDQKTFIINQNQIKLNIPPVVSRVSLSTHPAMSLFVGVDGGGTKTCCVIIDDARSIVARHVTGASNQNHVGETAAAKQVVRGY